MSAPRLTSWRWVVAAASGCRPYLHVRPCWSRDQARREAGMLNSSLPEPRWRVRKMVFSLFAPSGGPSGGLPPRVEQVPSTLGRRL